MTPKCPGQDQRYWTPKDIFDVGCPYCGREIEFWKDEPFRLCRGCGREVRNPRLDLACAEWCASADECLGHSSGQGAVASPVVERLMALLEERLTDRPDQLAGARAACARVDTLLRSHDADPRIAKAAAMLVGAVIDRPSRQRPSSGGVNLDPQTMHHLLCGAGIEERDARTIERIVETVLESETGADPESRIVLEAVQSALRAAR